MSLVGPILHTPNNQPSTVSSLVIDCSLYSSNHVPTGTAQVVSHSCSTPNEPKSQDKGAVSLDVELSKLFMRPFRRPRARRVHIKEDRARILAVWNYQNNPTFSDRRLTAPLIKQYIIFI